MTADVRRRDGRLLATLDGREAGAVELDPRADALWLRGCRVTPGAPVDDVLRALVDAAVDAAVGWPALAVAADDPAADLGWDRHGFTAGSRGSPPAGWRRPLATTYDVPDGEAMQALGTRVARGLVAGDLLVLSGELGAGKTTFAQGLGEGLGVRGGVTSPTFVIARVHPSLVGGPDLVHVDAYRLGGIEELDDLDLDTSLESAVTVVEWGEGLAEGLADQRLEVRIARAFGDSADDGLDPRVVTLRRVAPR